MRHRLLAALLAAFCAAGWPLAARAVTYTINLPLQLTNLPFPAGTTVNAVCSIWTSAALDQLPGPTQNMQGVSAFASASLNGQGSVSTTLKLTITEPSTAPAYKSYTCGLEQYASTGILLPGSQGNTQFQVSCSQANLTACVSGSFP